MVKYKGNSRSYLRDKESKLIYNKICNLVMKEGKKQITIRLLENVICFLKKQITGINPHKVFLTAIQNVSPIAELRPRITGRVTQNVPYPINQARALKGGARVLVSNILARKEPKILDRFCAEIMLSYTKKSKSYKDKLLLNKEIKQNRNLVRSIKILK